MRNSRYGAGVWLYLLFRARASMMGEDENCVHFMKKIMQIIKML